ncbi:hypothetical protein C8R45DRAFT_1156247 [Mycena sanguinolenta]|nr:hypothetical protein C8R45DRAFT_1156247 [Mycena sanguinolenta]
MFATKPLILLLAASLATAASTPFGRSTTYQVCAVCPPFDTEGNAVGPIWGSAGTFFPLGFSMKVLKALISFGDLGPNEFITKCFYDNSGALVQGTEFCPPGPVAVNEPPNCLVVTE